MASIELACQSAIPGTVACERFDAIESELARHPQVDMPVTHRFCDGMYVREIFMPAGTFCSSKIHLKQHPFVISKGRCRVWTDEQGVVELAAPYTGITQPGTRRFLHIIEDTVWVTFHITQKRTISEIEDEIIFKHDAHVLGTSIAHSSTQIYAEGTNELL